MTRLPWLPTTAGLRLLAAVLVLFVGAAVTRQAVSPPLCAAEPDAAALSFRLTDVSAQSGITFQHTDGGFGKRYIVESVVGGLALVDYDNDGWTDVYFTNGGRLAGGPADAPPRNALYRNRGDGTFVDVTAAAGVGDAAHSLGVVAGDYDNDGDQDLYVSNFGANALYCNQGDGTFTPVSSAAGLDDRPRVGAGACFLDVEGDGDLDLYAANYVDFSVDRHIVRSVAGKLFHPGPKDYPAAPDQLYRNDGDGTFTDVSGPAGIGAQASTGMGVLSLDFDEDADADIFVCNDSAANFLFQNDGQGRFEEIGLTANVAYDHAGRAHANMGVDCADLDQDGRLDLFVTGFSAEPPILFRNLGGGDFEDVTFRSGAASGLIAHANWGVGCVDFDHDGDRDIFVANGHFQDNIQYIDQRTDVRVANTLLANNGRGRFTDVSTRAGDGLALVQSSRGAGFDDLDCDGDVDVVVLNANDQPTILRNDLAPGRHWIQVRLVGIQANRDAAGAHVWFDGPSQSQRATVHLGRGYQSHYGATLHFGIAGPVGTAQVRVQWPGRRDVEQFPVTLNQSALLIERPGSAR